MKTIGELKHAASRALDGLWGKYAVMTLTVMVLGIVAAAAIVFLSRAINGSLDTDSFPYNFLQIVFEILILPLTWAYSIIFLRNLRGMDYVAGIRNLFDGYSDFFRIALTLLLEGVYTFLWALLLFVPGIIKHYSYAMTKFVLHDNPELAYNGAIERSMKLMKGHKMRLFLLDLSFIGWFLLSVVTLGIAFLWVAPYYNSTQAAFYNNLLEEEDGETSFNES